MKQLSLSKETLRVLDADADHARGAGDTTLILSDRCITQGGTCNRTRIFCEFTEGDTYTGL